MRKRYQMPINHNSEFDLDLAPLLAVMVKLVPVLLVSSAFVQMMIIETDIPQIVKEAIAQQETEKNPTIVSLQLNNGIKISVHNDKTESTNDFLPLINNQFDLDKLQLKLQEIKKNNPEVFKIEILPEENISYQQIVSIIDEARRTKNKELNFPIKDNKNNTLTSTDYMFPEVVFANTTTGE